MPRKVTGSGRLLAALVLASLGCQGKTTVSEGLKRSSSPGEMPALVRQPLAIAEADLPEQHYWPMAVGASGDVVYLASESTQPMFRVIDSTGRRLHAFGRTGDGPGEFRSPLEMQVRGDTLRIFDGRRMALLQYSWGGTALRESKALILDIPLSWVGDSVDHWVPPGMTRIEPSVITRSLVGSSQGRVVIAQQDSAFQALLASPPGGKRLMQLPYAVGADRIYLADAFHYRIYSYDLAGTLRATFGRDLPPHHRGPRELAALRASLILAGAPAAGPDGKPMVIPDQSRRLDTLEREISPHFVRTALHVDDAGRLWVVGVTNDSTTVDLFADTTFVGRAVLPCYLLRYGYPVSLNGHWLLLECGLPSHVDQESELQLYRIVDHQGKEPGLR